MSKTADKLKALRKLMAERKLDALYIPSEDAHQSEYIARWDARREFISGFTGSAGFAIVTREKAALWTDGRYFLQAEKQLDDNWTLMKAGVLAADSVVGIDALTISHDAAVKLSGALNLKSIKLELLDENLVDAIWTDRPPKILKEVFHLPTSFSGRSSAEKVTSIQNYLVDGKFHSFLVTALDEVAWLFNLRGSDISCNPCFFSYALVSTDRACLFLNHENLTHDAKERLSLDKVDIYPYEAIFDHLQALRSPLEAAEAKMLISASCNAALVKRIGAGNVVSKSSPIEQEKAIKNAVEIEGLRQCHIRDAAALVRYFAWLEEQLNMGATVDEVDGADKLEAFRSEGENFKGLSFDTISGSGPNGAIIHYKPERPSASRITKDALYLCDSGAQYLDGTTDVTRTVHFGSPTREEKEAFTRVLLGHIALDRAVFPAGTTGFMLDCLARHSLWEAGLDYRHGTGHGVGHFLNVHEGPQSISFHIRSHETALRPGMTVTNEPGFYADGKFGIRIENVLVVKEADTPNRFGGVAFHAFENLTMAPIQTKLMDLSLMTEKDIAWVNQHHSTVWDRVFPLLNNDPRALQYLRRETLPISK